MPDDRYEPWAEERREALRGTHLALLAELAASLEERGELGAAIWAWGRVLEEEPAHEQAHVGLVRLLALSER